MMDVIQQEFLVPVRYPVHFTTGVFGVSNALLRDLIAASNAEDDAPARVVVVVDRGVERAHPSLLDAIGAYCAAHKNALALSQPVLVVPGGETIKNDPRHVERILEAINAASLCRHSYLVAIGGGAVLDAAGYAAATAHRGIRLIRVPTTVLAQDDSAMGVKNGVNAFGKKNYLGTFAPPFAVINDFAFLSTLSDRDWRGGVAEAVKVALIRDPDVLRVPRAECARRCVDARSGGDGAGRPALRGAAPAHIATGGDPFELGLVAAARFRPLGGAQARAADRSPAAARRGGRRSASRSTPPTRIWPGSLPKPTGAASSSCCMALGLSIYVARARANTSTTPAGSAVACLRGLEEFREHLGGRLTIMLLSGIGRAVRRARDRPGRYDPEHRRAEDTADAARGIRPRRERPDA